MDEERANGPGAALVTGASAGIGEAFAERLAADGHCVIAVARRRDRLDDLVARLPGDRHQAVVSDLVDEGDLRRVEALITATPDLAMLVNCAGAGGYMPFVQLPADQAESLIRLHVVATTRLSRAALPGMIARGDGAIINVSSGLAFSASLPAPPLPHRAVYASCKSYMNTFSEILSQEVAGSGVRIQALCPGVVRTEFHEVAGQDVSHLPGMLKPADVVQASLAGLGLGEVVCIPAMDDPAVLQAATEARTAVFGAVRGASIAQRYADN